MSLELLPRDWLRIAVGCAVFSLNLLELEHESDNGFTDDCRTSVDPYRSFDGGSFARNEHRGLRVAVNRWRCVREDVPLLQ